MKACVIDEADKEADLTLSRPSRRATDDRPGYFRTIQNVHRTLIAHAVATTQADRGLLPQGAALEADWGLGRNPVNLDRDGHRHHAARGEAQHPVHVHGGARRRRAGIHPGHTPYCNLDDWDSGMTMGSPSKLYQNSYPADFKNTWPIGEGYFDSPWVWAHTEFTPQQTMRGKTALYGYLYGLGGASTPTYALTVSKSGTGSGTVTSSPAGISCGSDCSESYASGTSVTLTASAAGGSSFAGWSGACSGSGTCNVSMTAARSVTATFNTTGGTRGTFGNNGSPWAIAASGTTRIQAENFDTGGEGVAYHDSDAANSGGQYRTSEGVDIQATTDTGGGYNVGWIGAGEWLEYTVNVAAAGTYDLKLRTARQPTGTSTVSVLLGGIDKTGSLAVPSTGGWQTWTDLTRTGVSLSAGQQLMRVSMAGGSFNLNWIEITAAATSNTLTVTKAGSGSGTVTSSPAGISCGSSCSASYASGTNVTLTAAPAAGSTFAGWSGACSGAGSCAVTMSAARSVTATFNAATPVATIYGDALASDWASWSWSATIDFNGASPVRVGARAINVTYQAWGGLSLRKGTAQSTSGYTALKFWVHGGTGYDQVAACLHTDGRQRRRERFRRRQRTREHLDRDHRHPQLARQPGFDQAPQHPGEQRGHAADDDVRRDPPDAVGHGASNLRYTLSDVVRLDQVLRRAPIGEGTSAGTCGRTMETGGSSMIFRKKKETTEVKIARTAGRAAGKVARTAGKVADAVSRTNKAARRALARRKTRKTLERARRSLKTVGKAVAVAGLSAAAAATASELLKRRGNA